MQLQTAIIKIFDSFLPSDFRNRQRYSLYGREIKATTKIAIREEKTTMRVRHYKYVTIIILVVVVMFLPTLRFLLYEMSNHDRRLSTVSERSTIRGRPWRNERPVIGIITFDTPPDDPDKDLGSLRVAVSYVRFLEQAGARVVPIKGGQSESYYAQMASWTNGVFFSGGAEKLNNTPIGRAATIMFNLAMKFNQQGDYYPVFGICWGLQMLSYLIAGRVVNVETDSKDAMWSLDFTPEFRNSRLFGSTPNNIIEILSSQQVTQHHHGWSVPIQEYYDTDINKFFKLLSTNKDRQGIEFVSTLEAKEYPIYAIQWHPEKPIFLWDGDQHINRSAGTIAVGHYMADFVVNEARKSSHRFPSMEKEAEYIIWNNRYKFKYAPNEYFLEFYYMNPDD